MIEGPPASIDNRWSSERAGRSSRIGDGPRVVLAAVNGSPTAARAMSYAAGLARRNSSTLVLLHVHEPPSLTLWGEAMGAPAIGLVADDKGGELLERLSSAVLEQFDIRVECILRDGVAAKEITSVAREVHADVVIVGASCARLHLLDPSVPRQLVKHSCCPVTVVA